MTSVDIAAENCLPLFNWDPLGKNWPKGGILSIMRGSRSNSSELLATVGVVYSLLINSLSGFLISSSFYH